VSDDRIIAEYSSKHRWRSQRRQNRSPASNRPESFTRVPGETDELRERFAARLESVVELDSRPRPLSPAAPSKILAASFAAAACGSAIQRRTPGPTSDDRLNRCR
jgi:hypothetical protein